MDASALAIVEEEEALLRRVVSRLPRPAPRACNPQAGDMRSVETLRALREEAQAAQEDDLAPILHEMAVRSKLVARSEPERTPDPAAPYVAHLAVEEGGVTMDYLLGAASFIDAAAGVRVLDWRIAPVAQIFYRYREGDAYEEEMPGRTAEGVVAARRIVVIERGVLTRIVGDGFSLRKRADGDWEREDALAPVAGGGGAPARTGAGLDVTALLDRDQFEAIAAPPDEALVVLGTAGSGKTTVALHRLARLTAREPTRFPIDQVRVVVPEEGLARLARRLVAPLGASGVETQTLDGFFTELARRVFGALPKLCHEPPALVAALKRSPALYRALQARLAKPGRVEQATWKRLRRKVAILLTDRTFLGEVIDASAGTLSKSAIEETVRHTMLQLADPIGRQLRAVTDPAMKRAIDGRPIEAGTPEELAGTLDLEDLPILLCLRVWRGPLELPEIPHLVLDEAEDFSLFDLAVLRALLGASPSVTLAGDEAQDTLSCFAGWPEVQRTLGVPAARVCRLDVSYRCPLPVAEAAHRLMGTAPRAARSGPPVLDHHFPDEAQAMLFATGLALDLVRRDPGASIALVARNPERARRLHALVSHDPEARLVLHGEFTFEPGLDVTDIDNVKGLEWDYVIVPDATGEAYPASDEARRRLHVAFTRAAHQLVVVSFGARTPLLAPG